MGTESIFIKSEQNISAKNTQNPLDSVAFFRHHQAFLVPDTSTMYLAGSKLQHRPFYWIIPVCATLRTMQNLWEQGFQDFFRESQKNPNQPFFLMLLNLNATPLESYGQPIWDEINGLAPSKLLCPNVRVFGTIMKSTPDIPTIPIKKEFFSHWGVLTKELLSQENIKMPIGSSCYSDKSDNALSTFLEQYWGDAT